MRQPGVEPGSTAWKATMLTVTPLTLRCLFSQTTESRIKYHCQTNTKDNNVAVFWNAFVV